MSAFRLLCVFLFLISAPSLFGKTELYSRSFGSSEDPCVIFLHGGPGYNCASFEFTTANQLAETGFYVIVYDRRGEGRSPDPEVKYDFKESFTDLRALYKKYEVDKATLIGHSFGGLLATKFALKNKDLVSSVVLISSPICFQESFKTIIDSSLKIYTDKNDLNNLEYMSMLEKMDSTSLDYAVYCFAHAMNNGFYSVTSPTDEAKALYESIRADSTAKKFVTLMGRNATRGFYKNESYTNSDIRPDIKELMQNNIPVYGLYGTEDGLFSRPQIAELGEIIGSERLKYFENCSHSVFIDQQDKFLEAVESWLQ